MKRILAFSFAVIIAFSFVTAAFADNLVTCGICKSTFTSDAALQEHIRECHSYNVLVCPYCSNTFADENAYNDHIAICSEQLRAGAYDTSFSAIIDRLIRVFEGNSSWWDSIEDVLIRLIDLVENLGFMTIYKADVAGAVADLDNRVDLLGLPADILSYVKDCINTLKQKIKDFYSNCAETSAEETQPEAPAYTGSPSCAAAVLATACACVCAAFACRAKKKDE